MMNKLQKLSKEYEKDFELIPLYNKLVNTTDWEIYWSFVQKNLTYDQYKHYIKYYDNGIDIEYIMNIIPIITKPIIINILQLVLLSVIFY